MNFSVLMSVYIKENPGFLEQALLSIFSQTLMPSEVVIVEDGKLNEDLNNIILKFQNRYNEMVKVIYLNENEGLGSALNKGLLNCKYDIVARMDSDDIADSTRFEKQIKYLEKNKDVSMVGGFISEFNTEIGDLKRIREVPQFNEKILVKLKKKNCFNHMTVMFRKKAIIEAGGYIPCPYFEDYYLWCRMAINGCEFYNIPEILVFARVGNNMIERRGGIKYFKCLKVFYKKLLDIGYINIIEYMMSLFIRGGVALSPVVIRNKIYNKILRKKDINGRVS